MLELNQLFSLRGARVSLFTLYPWGIPREGYLVAQARIERAPSGYEPDEQTSTPPRRTGNAITGVR